MPFTGKATYTAGPTLPEIAEDVSDIIGIVSPYETPLLDHLGDPQRAATSTRHEWLEDELLPNTDAIDDTGLSDDTSSTTIGVAHADRFEIGDQIQAADQREVMFVTDVDTGTGEITVVRGYGGTTPLGVSDGDAIRILGNAALEGDQAPDARFTNRIRRGNFTQIFTAAVEVSGTEQAVNQIGVADELDYQKQERLRELLRDLENTVINGVAASSSPAGSASTRRTMNGILPLLTSNITDGGASQLDEAMLNSALRAIWDHSSGSVDTIVVNGFQKRRINSFITANRSFGQADTRFRDLVSMYESDFGVCRVVLSRWVPTDTVLLLDSSRLDVLPLAGRSFHFKPLAATGDKEAGQVIGEYTLELRHESAHGVIRNLATG